MMTLNVDTRWVMHSALGRRLYLGVALLLTTCCLNPVSVCKKGSLSNMNDTAISLAIRVSLCGVSATKSIIGIMISSQFPMLKLRDGSWAAADEHVLRPRQRSWT